MTGVEQWIGRLSVLLEQATPEHLAEAARRLADTAPIGRPDPGPVEPSLAVTVQQWEAPGQGVVEIRTTALAEVKLELVRIDPAQHAVPYTRTIRTQTGLTTVAVNLAAPGDYVRVVSPDGKLVAETIGAAAVPT